MTTVVLNTVTRKVEVFSSARDVLARAEIADHKAAADPHPQYLADADLAEVALSGDAGDLVAGTVPDARMPNWTGYSVASRTALEAANVPAAIDGLRLLGHATIGDGGGAHYKRVASEPAHPHKIQSADGAWWEEIFAVDVTVSIPADFATLQDAIDRLSKQPVRQGARIILNIAAGHALTAGLVVENGDYSHFKITSTDAEVLLAASFPTTTAVLKGVNARMPVWNILVNCNNQTVGSAEEAAAAIIAQKNSTLTLGEGAGAKNAGGAGLFVWRNSRVYGGSGCVFSGCSGRNVFVSNMCDVVLPEGDFRNSADPTAGVYVSRSCRLYSTGSNFSGATAVGLMVRRSHAVIIPAGDVTNTRFDNCGGYAIVAEMGSRVVAHHRSVPVVINNCGNGIYVDGTSVVDFRLGEISGVGNAFVVARGSTLNAQEAKALLVTGDVLNIGGASKAHIRRLVANGAGGYAVLAEAGSQVSASLANFSSNAGTNAIHSASGSHVDVGGTDLSLYTGAGVQLNVAAGGTISASGATYTTANQLANRLTSAGVIYDPGEDSFPLAGSNANGEFVKHSDGTLVCTHAMKAEYASASRLSASWTFPAAFVSNADFSWSAMMQRRSPANVQEGLANTAIRQSQVFEVSHLGTVLNVDVENNATIYVAGDFVWLSLTATGRWF